MFEPLTSAEWTAIALSIRVATIAALVSLPLGLAVAYILSRWRFPGRALLDAFVHLPLVMPPVVTGYLLLLTFGRRGPVGAFLDHTFGIVLAFQWTGAALAGAVMGFPLMVRAIRLSLDTADRKLEAAAATLGANRAWVLATVTFPLALPGILAGLVLSFARALGEFGATKTVPSAIYTYIQTPAGDLAALRLTLISVAIAFAALLVSDALSRRAAQRALGQ
jgi:molybdate transport system permease protein